MDIKDFKVGQVVYIKLVGNASRDKSGEELIQEWEIVSVGRKLIKAKRKDWSDMNAITFEKSGGGYDDRFIEKTDCCVNYVMYFSKKEIEDEIEKNELLMSTISFFQNINKREKLSLDSLRQITEIIRKNVDSCNSDNFN